MEPLKQKLTSRKFLLSIGVVVITILNQTLELGFDDASIATIAASVAAWVFGESVLDRERIAANQQVAFRNLQAEANEIVGRLTKDLKDAVEIINRLETDNATTHDDTSNV